MINLNGSVEAGVFVPDNWQTSAEVYTTSQGRRSITGTADWKEYTLALPEPSNDNIKSITLYLIMPPETKCTVYFDDISLYYT